MSHFATLVLHCEDQSIDGLLAPYMENCCGTPDYEYMEFYEDDDCDIDPVEDKRGYWQNPNAKWDWFVIGGRFSQMLRTVPGSGLAGAVDSAPLSAVDFAPTEEEMSVASRFWDEYVEGDGKAYEGTFILYKPEFYKRRYESKEVFLSCRGFNTFAVVTPDGEWHECGKMGWFGFSGETDEEAVAWERDFVKNFIEPADKSLIATIVDCHI